MSCLDPHGGVGKVQRACWCLEQAAAQHSDVCGAGALPGSAGWLFYTQHSPLMCPTSVKWLSKTLMWAGKGVYEQTWSWAAECHSGSIPSCFPASPSASPVPPGLKTSSCTLSLILCFICGYQETSSLQLFFLSLKTLSH